MQRFTNYPSSPTFAKFAACPAHRHDDPTSPPIATRGHPLAHGQSAKVAEAKTSRQPANGSFPENWATWGPWEQSQTSRQFYFQVRKPVPEP